jgi:hypothetical protein
MDDYEDIEIAMRILPGVDLTLWLRLIVVAALATIAAVIAVLAV